MRKALSTAALALAVTALSMTVLPASPAQAAGPVQFGRLQYDAPGPDSAVNTNGEYVSVSNLSARPVRLNGWTVRDLANHVYRFDNYVLPARRTVVIRTGSGVNGPLVRYWNRRAHVWNNTGDTVLLRSATGALLDRCTWGPGGNGSVNC